MKYTCRLSYQTLRKIHRLQLVWWDPPYRRLTAQDPFGGQDLDKKFELNYENFEQKLDTKFHDEFDNFDRKLDTKFHEDIF